jgi:kojibiose phosphorylase
MPEYPTGYHHFNCEETMLLKQPDVVMLLHLLPDEFDLETKRANFEFYEARTLHKSSLSPAIHAIMGLDVGDADRALAYFGRSAFVDLADNQGNTRDGIHIASAGGTWQVVVFGFAGFRIRDDVLTFAPRLPESWQRIRFRLTWRGLPVSVDVGHQDATFRLEASADTTLTIEVAGRPVDLVGGARHQVDLSVRPPLLDNSHPGKD